MHFLQCPSSNLLAGGPLHGPTVDVPPSIAVTSTLLRVAVGSRKVSCLLAHGEQNCAGCTNRHKRQSTQYWSNGNYIQNLLLHAAFVNNSWVALVQPSCQVNTLSKKSYKQSKLHKRTKCSKQTVQHHETLQTWLFRFVSLSIHTLVIPTICSKRFFFFWSRSKK